LDFCFSIKLTDKAMTRIKFALATALSLAFTPLAAQDLSGWCLPADECMGVQMPIGSGTYDTCEERCTLTNPVPVRDMDATLYDEVCRGDWMENGSMTNRIMFIKQSSDQTRMFAIREGWITQLERCK
jgi:hypothetical protein